MSCHYFDSFLLGAAFAVCVLIGGAGLVAGLAYRSVKRVLQGL